MTPDTLACHETPFPTALGELRAMAYARNGELRARFGDLELASVFQPIYSPVHQRTVGYEALLRAYGPDGHPVPPPEVFSLTTGNERATIHLDRLCRFLHVANFQRHDMHGWLFLNISPQVVAYGNRYGPFFRELLESEGLPPSRVVVEILEGDIQDEHRLARAVNYYRELGCLVAIDDFGAGHSNFSRILRLAPHIVKLDRGMMRSAQEQALARRLLPNLVGLLREAGCLVLLEGIEEREEALLALHTDADFAQGYFFARPSSQPIPAEELAPELKDLDSEFALVAEVHRRSSDEVVAPYAATFTRSALDVMGGTEVDAACRPLLHMERVTRCYMIDERGRQLGENLLSLQNAAHADPRFQPLHDAKGAYWNRRHYFRAAVAEPGRLQVSRPYLSLTGACLCVTLSMALYTPTGKQVLCCDLAWSED